MQDAAGCTWIFPRPKKHATSIFFTSASQRPASSNPFSFSAIKKNPNRMVGAFLWRRRRDLNPRYPFGVYTISNRARSASYATSPDCSSRSQLEHNTTQVTFCQVIFKNIFKKIIGGNYSAKTLAIAWVTCAQRLAAAASKVG